MWKRLNSNQMYDNFSYREVLQYIYSKLSFTQHALLYVWYPLIIIDI